MKLTTSIDALSNNNKNNTNHWVQQSQLLIEYNENLDDNVSENEPDKNKLDKLVFRKQIL